MTEQKVFSFDWGRREDGDGYEGVLYELPWTEERSIELAADTLVGLFDLAGEEAERMFGK